VKNDDPDFSRENPKSKIRNPKSFNRMGSKAFNP
jgi:hypothetical protein